MMAADDRDRAGNERLSVSVRMYKNILGDCFLLKFDLPQSRSRVLIDCGIIQGVAGAKEAMKAIAEDIVRECGGDPEQGRAGTLDLLVVTHEHWDHISGFGWAKDVFLDKSRLRIENLWMAWTEDPKDDLANQLRERFEDRKKLVAMMGAVASGDNHPFGAAPAAARTQLEQFVGPIDGVPGPGFGAAEDAEAFGIQGRITGRKIMEALKQAVVGEPKYLRPGQVRETPGVGRVRAYVLGPPRSTDRLFKDKPSKGEDKETYLAEPDLALEPLLAVAQGDTDQLGNHSPFARPHRALTRKLVDEMRAQPDQRSDEIGNVLRWLEDHYFLDETPCRYGGSPPPRHDCGTDPFCRADQAGRRIDHDWLAAGGRLALKLDSDTNNTSLVLAFELPDGDVMLFAADAQVGNWESWHDQTYPIDGRPVTAEDLLARTVLYKVGHHGSHNATLKDKGLELMTHPGLAAMIPVVEDVARSMGKGDWDMPFPELKAELLTKTSGRILRGDCPKGRDRDGGKETELPGEEAFLARVDEDPGGLWVEYRVRG